MIDISYVQDKIILAPTNSIVDQINDYMLDLMSGEEKTYLSYDNPLTQNGNCDVVDDVHSGRSSLGPMGAMAPPRFLYI